MLLPYAAVCLVLAPGLIEEYVQSDASEDARSLQTVRAIGEIVLGGRLDEDSWATVSAVSDFLQLDPDEGESATEMTQLRILYDDDALYFGVHMEDSDPASLCDASHGGIPSPMPTGSLCSWIHTTTILPVSCSRSARPTSDVTPAFPTTHPETIPGTACGILPLLLTKTGGHWKCESRSVS